MPPPFPRVAGIFASMSVRRGEPESWPGVVLEDLGAYVVGLGSASASLGPLCRFRVPAASRGSAGVVAACRLVSRGVPQQSGGTVSSAAEVAREVNEEIRAIAERLDPDGDGDGVSMYGFSCEDGCGATVPLTLAAFIAGGGAWLDGHRPER